jgi:hypothetical protein
MSSEAADFWDLAKTPDQVRDQEAGSGVVRLIPAWIEGSHARILVMNTPGGFERMFELAPKTPEDAARRAATAAWRTASTTGCESPVWRT